MPGWKVSGLALAEGLAGFTLLWSGLTNTGIKDTLTGFLSGNPVAVGSNPGTPPTIGIADNLATAGAAAAGSGSGSGSPSSAGSGSGASAPAAPSSVSGNVATGKLLAAPYGWSTGAEWNALYALWERESGWSNTVWNTQGSGAYGIAQALPATKYPAAGQAPPVGSSSASAQISWGLSYIKSRYGDPIAAWAHEESAGWY